MALPGGQAVDEDESAIRVLCVDDEAGVVETTAEFLERAGFEVLTDTSPAAALDRLSTTTVDCIVSDYRMPEMDGVEFLEAVRAEHDDLPFVLFTGQGSEEVASDAFSAGADEYLQKSTGPDQYELLANRVRTVVGNYRARRALERREEQFRTLIEYSTDMIVTLDEEGRFRYVSPSAERIMGYRPAELLGEDAFQFMHPDDRGEILDLFESLIETQESMESAEFRYEHASGEWRILEARGRNLLEDPAVEAIVANIRDVTEHRRAERRFHALAEHSPAPIAVLDPAGRFEYVSPSVEEVFGYPPAALECEQALAYVHPDDHDAVEAAFDGVVESDDDLVTHELRFQTHDDEWRVVEITARDRLDDPAVEGVVINARDVTERVERARALREETEFVDSVLDALDDIVYVFDTDGHPIRWNDRANEVLGYTDAEIEGMHTLEFVADEDEEHIAAGMERVMAEGESRTTARLVTRDGEHIPYEFHGSRLEGPDGSVEGFCGIARDISERRERERQLRRQNERLEEFASVIGHDLQSPLNVATANLELAAETGEAEHFERARNAHERIERLVDNLYQLARQGQVVGETTGVDLEAVAADAWETTDTAEASLVVEASCTLQADPDRLEQLLQNLFRNSVEHGTDFPDAADLTIRVGSLEDGFSVADDGRGIPPDEREAVFERGHSADGAGFGLAIVRTIADAHGWSVAVTEGPEGGARFEFTGVDLGA